MKLKIFNPEVVDCSSSWNELVPNPQSKNLLLDIFVKLCESDAILIITGHSLSLSFNPSGTLYSDIEIEFKSPNSYGFEDSDEYIPIINYIKQEGKTAELNKIAGLFLESENIAYERLKSYNIYLMPPGLNGIKKSESIIKAYYSGNFSSLPNFLPKKNLYDFSINAGVIWKAWVQYIDDPEHGRVIDYSNRIDDAISAESWEMTLNLGRICLGGQQGRENGDKHYPDIQKVLEENWPNMFKVEELNGG